MVASFFTRKTLHLLIFPVIGGLPVVNAVNRAHAWIEAQLVHCKWRGEICVHHSQEVVESVL